MLSYVYCEKSRNNTISFYITYKDTDYYLFSQKFSKDTYNTYYKGIPLNRAMQPSLARDNRAILKTIEKLPIYIKYVEREEGFYVLDKSIKKHAA